MRVLIVVIMLLVFITPAQAKCRVKYGHAKVAWGLVYKFADTNCDGLWDTFQEVKMTSKGWEYSKEKSKVPEKFRKVRLPKILR